LKRLLVIILPVMMLLPACASRQVRPPSLLETAAYQRTGLEVTLLPVLDSRKYPGDDEFPDLENRATIIIPAEEITAPGKKIFLRQSLFSAIRTYTGPLPEQSGFKWSAFPLRGLDTDLALGLEIKRLDIKKTARSSFMAPRALLDAAFLPFSALGTLISHGHFDLGGWLIPAGEISYTLEIELNILSLKGGGLIFSKTYEVEEKESAVSDRDLYKGFSRSHQDGQSLGRAALPRLTERIFFQICQDPELGYLPKYVKLAWLDRVFSEVRIKPEVKAGLLMDLNTEIVLPSLTGAEIKAIASSSPLLKKIEKAYHAEHEAYLPPVHVTQLQKMRSLGAYDVDPAWLESEAARVKLLDQACWILLALSGELNLKKMDAALSEAETTLMEHTMALLGRLGQNYTANQILRFRLHSPETAINEKKGIVLLLSRALETLDNEEFINQEIDTLVKNLKHGSSEEKLEAATLLIALQGSKAMKERAISQDLFFKALSTDDTWAASIILHELEQGNLGPEIVRLAGALNLTKALPILLTAFKTSVKESRLPPHKLSPEKLERIPLHPVPQKKVSEKTGPDPILVVRALGNFRQEPQVPAAFRAFLARMLSENKLGSGQADLVAEVIRSLGRLGDQASEEAIFELWSRKWPQPREAHFIRRAALEALTRLNGKGMWSRILETVQHKINDLTGNQAMFREAADFFGQAKYAGAVPLLIEIINHPDASDLMLKTCFQALSRIASPEAEARLTHIAFGSVWHLSQGAASALEGLTLERALWEGLKGIE